jgi:hypothetical protein
MTASYPSSLKTFTTHVNLNDTIDSSHVNALQDEVSAVESILGTTPSLSTTPNAGGTFNATATTFSTVGARLANIETGVVADSHTQYVKKAADTANIITPSAIGNKGLVIKAMAGQTANLTEWQAAGSSTAVTYIDSTGTLKGVSVSGSITIGTTVINLNGSTSALVGVTLTSPIINSPTINSATLNLSINTQTVTAYSFQASDLYSFVPLSNASAITVTIPSGLSATPGVQLNFAQYGAGQVTVVGASGVTVLSTGAAPSTPKTRVQYSLITLIQVATNSWLATGDLV